MWRWRDERMAVLSIWFWMIVFVGGVLTIDPPYMARMVGIIPLLPIFAAIPLNKMAAELTGLAAHVRLHLVHEIQTRRAAHLVSGAALLLVSIYLAVQNYNNYYVLYPATYPHPKSLGQAVFVRQMNQRAVREGRPLPVYYDAGVDGQATVLWTHGTNRFLNHGVVGRDMVNPSQDLPLINDASRDVMFMLWGSNAKYLPLIKSYYPDGEQGEFRFGPDVDPVNVLTYYLVRREQIEDTRYSTASYTSVGGERIVERREGSIGTASPPPSAGLDYPVEATWRGGLLAPAFGNYRFQLSSRSGASLSIDGTPVLTGTSAATEVTLGRGVHDVQLSGMLPGRSDEIELLWDAGAAESDGSSMLSIAPSYLYSEWRGGLAGEIRMLDYPSRDLTADMDDWGELPLLYRSLEGFLSYSGLADVLSASGLNVDAFVGKWEGQLHVTEEGDYTFDLAGGGSSVLLVDNQVLLDYPEGNSLENALTELTGEQIRLTPGEHHFEVRYKWNGGPSNLEAFWKPPGGERTLIGPDALVGQGTASIDSNSDTPQP
jgi:hypothetical protein